MTFWNSIFNDAISKFIAMPEPKGRSKTRYSIRDKTDWDAVYTTLELAQNKYNTEGGPVGWLRKIRRKAADNVAPMAAAVKSARGAVPDNPYSTPVLGAVGILLDVRRGYPFYGNQPTLLTYNCSRLGCQAGRSRAPRGPRGLRQTHDNLLRHRGLSGDLP